MRKNLFVLAGSLCVILGILGIVVPGLPTTPFLLLASWLFYRSSQQLQQKLLNSWLGKYIRNYEKERGMRICAKLWAIGLMVVMCSISIIFCIQTTWVKIVVAVAGLIGVIVVGFVVPTVKRRK